MFSALPLPLFWLLFAVLAQGEALTPEDATLSVEARGVLAHHCTKCHGQQKQKGDLRLDLKSSALAGGKDGAVIVPGKPAESELIRRVTLPLEDDDRMPPKSGDLDPAEVATLQKWVAAQAPWPDGATAGIVFRRAAVPPRKPAFPPGTESFENPIDRFTAGYFRAHHLDWPASVDDRAYLRRASLDITGLLPSWEDAAAFDGNRGALVDRLLASRHDYATHWLTFWNDALRNDYSGPGYIDGGRKQISKWLYEALLEDKPYDQFVRELIKPGPDSDGFIRGIVWRGSVSAGQRVELQAAQNVAQVFLGLNLKCCSCHDSFINDYKLVDSHALAAVFTDQPVPVFRCDKETGAKVQPAFLWPEFGGIDLTKPRAERQQQLAEILTRPEDGRLARTLVNRLWAACFGRGFIEPVDVMDNSPWDADLLDWLASDFAESGYDVQRTLRLILTSRAYQLPAVPVTDPADVTAPGFVFLGPLVRRLTAEEFTDAIAALAAPLYSRPDFPLDRIGDGLTENTPWIWHPDKEQSGVSFPGGKRCFRYTFALPGDSEVRLAQVVGTADNAFDLFINGTKALSSSAWETAVSADVTPQLSAKKSITLAVLADNFEPGPAGLRLALAVWFKNQKTPLVVRTSPDWRSSVEAPPGWEQPAFDDQLWDASIVLGPEGLPWGGLRGFVLQGKRTVRAALVNNDPLQASLGRPNRDQVNLSRTSSSTLLQALTFANGRPFNDALSRGAASWDLRFPDPRERLTQIYRTALLRSPREDEFAFAAHPTEDLLWALVLQPEFQLIR